MLALLVTLPSRARAHCDSLDGPVIRDARAAFERGDVGPVLKWVGAEDEALIRSAFAQAAAVRANGGEARELADQHFFETLVRVHRLGEGEGFTGLEPAGSVDPGLAAADRALASGSGEELSAELSAAVAREVQRRFSRVHDLRERADDSTAAGRAYVAAYVEYAHFVEAVHRLTQSGASHRHGEPAAHEGH
jgi:hypothetical protein